jgi:hypothetical protein
VYLEYEGVLVLGEELVFAELFGDWCETYK